MSGSRAQPSQPPKGHPDPASLEYLCHFPGDLVAAPSTEVLDGSEAAGLAQDAHRQLDELFRDKLPESVAQGVDGGLVGRFLLAASDPVGGRNGRRFGRVHGLQGQIRQGTGIAHSSSPVIARHIPGTH